MLRKFITGFLMISGVGFLLIMGVMAFQDRLIFFPEELPEDYNFDFNKPFEEKFFDVAPDAKIHGLHFYADEPKGVILYFHGNAGSLRSWGYISEELVPYGYDLLIIDYRGFGKSTGPINEEALHNDAEHVYNYLTEHYNEDSIIVYGRSIGTGISLKLASKHHPAKVILESPFYNFQDLAGKHFPFLPVSLLLEYSFPSNEWIRDVSAPVYIVHGTEDQVIPFSSGRKLADLVPEERRYFIAIEGGGHNDLSMFDEHRLFLDEALARDDKQEASK